MNYKKTPRLVGACLVALFAITLSTLSSLVNADPAPEAIPENRFVDLASEAHSNLWHWLFFEATKQSIQAANEIQCLALNVYFEARSETIEGQYAVGYVVMNRVAHSGFPNSICGVVKQGGEEPRNRCQFSWWCDGRPDKPTNHKVWLKSLSTAYDIYLGQVNDPTQGALWYHADYVSPKWSKALTMVTKIGQHLFYLDRKPVTYAMNQMPPAL
jgi:spore germination cell wall hydrolase CwlJ-like protein